MTDKPAGFSVIFDTGKDNEVFGRIDFEIKFSGEFDEWDDEKRLGFTNGVATLVAGALQPPVHDGSQPLSETEDI